MGSDPFNIKMWSIIGSVLLLAYVVSAEIPAWMQCQPDRVHTVPDDMYCDKYYLCKDGVAKELVCEDGLGFVPYGGCKFLYQVQCGTRNLLQSPKGKDKCPRLNGMFPAAEGCGRFYKCFHGRAEIDACPTGQMFDEIRAECRYPTDEEGKACADVWEKHQQKQPLSDPILSYMKIELLPDPNKFECPAKDSYPYNDHSRHGITGSCKLFLACMKDGSKRLGLCPDGQGFNSKTTLCEDTGNIPVCYAH